MAESFYWFDYETFGTKPEWDRPAQFAGLRTTVSLEPVGSPLVLYCRPALDMLPDPFACAVTGLTPQNVAARGLDEAAFIDRVVGELARPGTCAVGYNNIRFDDEFTRHTLFRNLREPYAHEWQHGNSRWDLLDVVRLTRALRPEGIEWPEHANGKPSNRLEDLTAANGLEHSDAHDALSDVRATIAVAGLIRRRQPRLFDYVLAHRSKREAARLLDLHQPTPCLQVSRMVPAQHGHTAIIVPLLPHPDNSNGIIVLDLRSDPRQLLDLDAETIRQRVFAGSAAEQAERLHLRTVGLNRCPVLAPLKALRPADAERLDIDLDRQRQHAELLSAMDRTDIDQKLHAVFHREPGNDPVDVDGSLYQGGFLELHDRRELERLCSLDPAALAAAKPVFRDPRLAEMLFRYRARNFPDSLDETETSHWRNATVERLTRDHAPWMTFHRFDALLAELAAQPGNESLIDALARFRNARAAELGLNRAPLE